ncbi:uncharacterized protein F5147DRAFT_799114 [Suillus discolor]|uniref:Uncharacterized protein n=1 Tax=Suillus discolor TaxID=1912936 RepID=A0A9P7JU49_9AGAM|nr:uncharacterized protein F5147DRAFT_799114 [Suillus discolor]KAG2109045.1 hypothetical protein F5147DRAFT_799114 [Suillus discolor]
MGRTYLARFHEFADAAEVDGLQAVNRWRVEQQAEWNRVSNTLAFLATMSAAILAISPPAPPLAFSVWLGAAGLSVCGLFIVQYFPIQAFSISDEDMAELVKGCNYINPTFLAIAVASPVIFALWSSILFAVGIVDYIFENTRGKPRFMLLSLVPVAIGFMASAAVMVIASIIGQRVQARVGDLLLIFYLFDPFSPNFTSIREGHATGGMAYRAMMEMVCNLSFIFISAVNMPHRKCIELDADERGRLTLRGCRLSCTTTISSFHTA